MYALWDLYQDQFQMAVNLTAFLYILDRARINKILENYNAGPNTELDI